MFSTLLTFTLVTLLWVFFRAGTLDQAFSLLGRIFSPWDVGSGITQLGMAWSDAARLLLTLTVLPLLQREDRDPLTQTFLFLIIALAWLIRLDTGGISAFIYFRF